MRTLHISAAVVVTAVMLGKTTGVTFATYEKMQ